MMQEMVGDMEKDEAMLKAASPVYHADRITAPLLIARLPGQAVYIQGGP